MKWLIAPVASLVLAAGCAKQEPAQAVAPVAPAVPAVAVESQPATVAAPVPVAPALPGAAPVASVPAPAAAETQQQSAVVKPLSDYDVQMLNYAVYMYKEQFQRYPRSLEEMVGTPHLARVPVTPASQKLVYDSNTGTVKVVNSSL